MTTEVVIAEKAFSAGFSRAYRSSLFLLQKLVVVSPNHLHSCNHINQLYSESRDNHVSLKAANDFRSSFFTFFHFTYFGCARGNREGKFYYLHKLTSFLRYKLYTNGHYLRQSLND